MSLDTDLYTKLMAESAYPVQQNTISEDKDEPYVWFMRSQDNQDLTLDGNTNLLRESWFDVEVIGLEVSAVETEADTLREALNGFHGAMGDTTVLGMFVFDADSDYLSRTTAADSGLHVAAFRVQLLT